MDLYLVHGYINDGYSGIPFNLGVFDHLIYAEQAILKFINGPDIKYERSENGYLVEDYNRKVTYCISITKYKLNEINQNQFKDRFHD